MFLNTSFKNAGHCTVQMFSLSAITTTNSSSFFINKIRCLRNSVLDRISPALGVLVFDAFLLLFLFRCPIVTKKTVIV